MAGVMTKKESKNRRVKQPPNPVATTPTPLKALRYGRKLWVLTIKIVSGIALLLGIIGTYYSFSPKLFVDSKESLDPSNIFATPFSIKNESLLSLYNVYVQILILKAEAPESGGASIHGTTTAGFIPTIPKLKSGETTTVFVNFPISFMTPIKDADVEIKVAYRPALLWFRKEKAFRFSTAKLGEGARHWVQRATSEYGGRED